MSVNLFNEKLINEGADYRLSVNYNSYNMKPSKKNGIAKTDLPSTNNL